MDFYILYQVAIYDKYLFDMNVALSVNTYIKFPMTIQQQSPRGPMTMTIDNVKINKGLKDSDFIVK